MLIHRIFTHLQGGTGSFRKIYDHSEAESDGEGLVHLEIPSGSARGVALSGKVDVVLTGGSLKGTKFVQGQIVFWKGEQDREQVRLAIGLDELQTVRSASKIYRAIRVPVRGSEPVRVRIESMSRSLAFQGDEESYHLLAIGVAERGELSLEVGQPSTGKLLRVRMGR